MNKNHQGARFFVALMSLISKLSSSHGTSLELFSETGPETNVVLNFAILVLLVRFTWAQDERGKTELKFQDLAYALDMLAVQKCAAFSEQRQ